MNRDHVYLSGPMTGIPDDNYPAFNKAAKKLARLGFKVMNPAAQAPCASWEDYMRVDIAQLVTRCRGIITLPGWEASRGATLEVHIATQLAMPRVSIRDEINLVRLLHHPEQIQTPDTTTVTVPLINIPARPDWKDTAS